MSPRDGVLRACLFPLLEALGWQGDRGALEEYLGGPREPSGVGEFRNAMAALRFGSRSAALHLDEVVEASMPCLFIKDGGEAFCLFNRRGDEFFAYDGVAERYVSLPVSPARGRAVSFSPLGDDAESVLASRPDWLWVIGKRFKAHLGAALGISLALGLLSLLYPLLIATLYSQMTIRGNEDAVLKLGAGAAIFIVADSGFRYLRSVLLGYTSLRSGTIIGGELFRRLLSFQSSFTEAASSEAQIRRIKDLRTVADFIAGSALAAIFDLPFVVIMIVWLVSVGGSVALVPTLGLLVFIVACLAVYPAMKRAQGSAATVRAERMDLAASMIEGAEDIAAAGMGGDWRERFLALSSRAAAAGYSESSSSAGIAALSGLFVSAGGLATLYAGTHAVLDGKMPASALVAAMMLVWRVLGIARSTFVVLSQIDALGGSLRQLRRFMSLPQETRPTAFIVPSRAPEGDLQFKDVSFRYGPEGYPTLYSVTFTAAAGKVTALAGNQGSGKTTALKLAMGLYRPQAGRILIGPFNIQQADSAQLRRALSYAPQKPALLRGRLRDFIRGSSGADDDGIEEAAEALGLAAALREAGLSLDAELGADLDSFPTDTARLALICRACLRRSSLYLFDEQPFIFAECYQAGFTAMLRKLADGGAVVLVATQTAPGRGVADLVASLDSGRLVPIAGGKQS